MLFDIIPKSKKTDLYGVDVLYNTLMEKYNDNTKLIVLSGLRRTGKTSLLKVSLNESKRKFVFVDSRLAPYTDRNLFLEFLSKEISKVISTSKISKVGLSVGNDLLKGKVDFQFNDYSDLLSILKIANDQKIILAFDEAQYLAKINFDEIIASIFDNFNNITLILTGSEIGLLYDFLGTKNNKAPLFGRLFTELTTERFSKEKSIDFLKKGFEENNLMINNSELYATIDKLDGIIGWTTYYGYLRVVDRKTHLNALEQVINLGAKTAFEELDKFLINRKARDKYLLLIKEISLGNNTWTQLKKRLKQKFNKINDSQLNTYINALLYHGFIEKKERIYYVGDPLLIKAVFENQIL